MFRLLHKIIFILTLFVFCYHADGQTQITKTVTEDKIEDTVLSLLHHIDVMKQEDSIAMANKDLMDYLKKACVSNPATLSMKFKRIETEMDITTSDDGKIRVYSWKTALESTSYNVLMQYKTTKGVKIYQMNQPGDSLSAHTVPSSIKSITTKAKKTCYIFIEGVFGEHGLEKEKAIANTFINDVMITYPLFQTTTGTTTELSHTTTAHEYDPTVIIHFSADKQTLYIPSSTPEGMKEKTYALYKFNGLKFVYTGDAKE